MWLLIIDVGAFVQLDLASERGLALVAATFERVETALELAGALDRFD